LWFKIGCSIGTFSRDFAPGAGVMVQREMEKPGLGAKV